MTAVRGSVLCIFSRRCGGMSRVVTWRCDLSGQAEVRKLAKPDPPSCGHVVRGRKGQWGRSRTDRAKPELQTEVDWYPVRLIDRARWLDVHAREPSGQQACAEPRITRALRTCQAGLTSAAYQKPPSWMSRRYYRLLLGGAKVRPLARMRRRVRRALLAPRSGAAITAISHVMLLSLARFLSAPPCASPALAGSTPNHGTAFHSASPDNGPRLTLSSPQPNFASELASHVHGLSVVERR